MTGSIVECYDCFTLLFVEHGKELKHECNGSAETVNIVDGTDNGQNLILVTKALSDEVQ